VAPGCLRIIGIERTAHTFATPLEDVCIDHGRTDIFVSQELLHRPNIIAIFYQMRGKTMPPMPRSA